MTRAFAGDLLEGRASTDLRGALASEALSIAPHTCIRSIQKDQTMMQ